MPFEGGYKHYIVISAIEYKAYQEAGFNMGQFVVAGYLPLRA